MMDRIGRKTIQILGFAMMALSFAAIALIPGIEKLIYPFLIIYGISYFFTEFGPNATTFVYPAELFPVEGRTTGHGIAVGRRQDRRLRRRLPVPDPAGAARPVRGRIGARRSVSVLGHRSSPSFMLPETKGKSLEELSALPAR